MSFLHISFFFSYEMMLMNAEENTFILLKGALFEISFHNDRLFIYRNTLPTLKKDPSGIILYLNHFISGKFLNSSGVHRKGPQTSSNL